MTEGDRAFPAKFRLKDVPSQDLKELRRIRTLVESSAIRWPVVQRSSPLYPRDIIEEMREKALKKDENYRQRLAENEARSSLATKHYTDQVASSSAIPQPAAQVPAVPPVEIPSKDPMIEGGDLDLLKGKAKSLQTV